MIKPAFLRCLVLLILMVLMVLPGCSGAQKKREEQAKRTRQLAESYLHQDNLPMAYQELMAAQKLAPNDPDIHFDFGAFYYKRKMYDKAIEEYKTAISLKPYFPNAINNLGVAYLAAGEVDNAIETLTPLTQNFAYASPHLPNFLLGQAYFQKHNYPEAINHLKEATLLQPNFSYAHHWLGKVLMADGQTAQAIEALEKAISIEPRAAVFHLDLARAYLQAQQYQKAENTAAQSASLATDPDLKQDALQLKRLARKKK